VAPERVLFYLSTFARFESDIRFLAPKGLLDECSFFCDNCLTTKYTVSFTEVAILGTTSIPDSIKNN
jgi:hypothetical protein